MKKIMKKKFQMELSILNHISALPKINHSSLSKENKDNSINSLDLSLEIKSKGIGIKLAPIEKLNALAMKKNIN
jgi:hypothetical protein